MRGVRFMGRFPRKISRIEPLNLVGTARCAVRAAFSGATMPPAASRAGTSQRDVPTKVRLMGRMIAMTTFESLQADQWSPAGKIRLLTSTATNAGETCARLRLGIAFVLALLSVGLTGCFKVGSDVGALRDSVMKSTAARWDEKIEIGVGPITLYLARAGLAFVDLEPEARTALHAVRGAEVGVYKLREGHKELKRAVILSAADKAMASRGWDRIVGVLNQGEFVAIYVRHDLRSTRNVRVCLLTLSGEGMVVASARSNLEPLMEIAFKRAEWRQKGRAPIHF